MRDRASRWARRIGWMVAGMASGGVVVYLLATTSGPDLERWHRTTFDEELRAKEAELASFGDLLALEERLFAELDAANRGIEAFPPYSRFDPTSPTNPLEYETNWNRTFVMDGHDDGGAAVLMHGLSDSPYSVKALAEVLAAEGLTVIGLRVPGHGTMPAELTRARWEDWRLAVRLAMAEGEQLAGDGPLVIGGYSNGAALALEYVLESLDDAELATPDRVVFLSPAIAVSPIARFARYQGWLSRLPRLGKLAWNSRNLEFDPYKYNSFPVNAGAQIFRLTTHLESLLARLERGGRLDEIPPVLTLQSVVDATVPPVPSLRRLYSRLLDNDSELVLFDANRQAHIEPLLGAQVNELTSFLDVDEPFEFSVTLVTNASPATPRVEALTRRAGRTELVPEPLDLEWPAGLYSLSHVAIPFPPGSAIYGVDRSAGDPFPFGLMEARGERGLLLIPQNLLIRLRYNPFFPYLERRVAAFVRGERWDDVVSEPIDGHETPAEPAVEEPAA